MSAIREPDTDDLIRRAASGERGAISPLLDRHRSRLRRVVALRMNRRLAQRLDPSDIVQETMLEATRRLPEYLKKPAVPFFVWLRQMGLERVIDQERRHLHARKRGAGREVGPGDLPGSSVHVLARKLIGHEPGPDTAALRDERRRQVRAALERLAEADRVVLVLRYVEQLSLKEIAGVVQSSEAAVKVRHFRALKRLRALLEDEG